VTPVNEHADFGVIFVHNEGYSDHCGHGTIALATAAVELGWIDRACPETRVGIDAPCGFIEAFVSWDGERAGSVRFVNVPSFVEVRHAKVTTPSFGEVRGTIAFGGAYYFYVNGRNHGLTIKPDQVEVLTRFGDEVQSAANDTYQFCHPEIPELNAVYGTIIDGDPLRPGSDQSNCCIFADRQVDRSPTGSGTAGRVAMLYAQGSLALGQPLINDSIVGSTFVGRALKETRVGSVAAVIPEIAGQAAIIGLAEWFLCDDAIEDPLGRGFLVR
jgi:trans-L-3-hydroxyproline dehydratase